MRQLTATVTRRHRGPERELITIKTHPLGFASPLNFYPRDAMLARVIAIATCLSVRPSVCLSVKRRYCVKKKKASVMISSLPGSPKILVF